MLLERLGCMLVAITLVPNDYFAGVSSLSDFISNEFLSTFPTVISMVYSVNSGPHFAIDFKRGE